MDSNVSHVVNVALVVETQKLAVREITQIEGQQSVAHGQRGSCGTGTESGSVD